ncbi:MAG TPA: hypothetical protein VHK01_11580 [Lacipirellulaceae bacterium]|nr:hypothetical protein [Lacipirellulaceae bacterium]
MSRSVLLVAEILAGLTSTAIRTALGTLERQGLAGSAWEWVADLEFRRQNY